MTKKRLTEDQIKSIKELAKKGYSEREIAKAVGCSRSSVWKYKRA